MHSQGTFAVGSSSNGTVLPPFRVRRYPSDSAGRLVVSQRLTHLPLPGSSAAEADVLGHPRSASACRQGVGPSRAADHVVSVFVSSAKTIPPTHRGRIDDPVFS
jgi:hypothetical protein